MDKGIFDFHADDFALSLSSSQDIQTLGCKGAIQSISIIPNMSAFDQAIQLAAALPQNVKRSIHLNFMEGKSCLGRADVPDLVDDKGFFKVSWGGLLLASYNPFRRNVLRKQLSAEIVAQVEKCIASGLAEPKALRLDSHQHTHMIPLVQDSLFDAIDYLEKGGRKVVFVRNTEDPVMLYLRAKGALQGFSPVNIIKCLILNLFSIRLKAGLAKRNLPIGYLCGVFYSGHMDKEHLNRVLPAFEVRARKESRTVEVLFHPGSVKKEEILPEFNKPGFVAFHLSKNRHIEFNALCKLSGVSI